MKHVKSYKLFEAHKTEEYWTIFKNYLYEHGVDLYDGEEYIQEFFEETLNKNIDTIEKVESITNYIEEHIGLYDGYEEVLEFLENLLKLK